MEIERNNNIATIKDYENCRKCGEPSKSFRPAKAGDYPTVCTIGPIIVKDKK